MPPKIAEDKTEGVMVVPQWAMLSWFPHLLAMLVAEPIILPLNGCMLVLSRIGSVHPLHDNYIYVLAVYPGIPGSKRSTTRD